MNTVYDFNLNDLEGKPMAFSQYRGKVLLLVNVASKCGLTPQYDALQKLVDRFGAQGFQIIGLPCNQFAGQEPGSPSEIRSFCDNQYHVTFPLTTKIEVNGKRRHSLYAFLAGSEAAFPGDITWNFEKFLIDKQGHVIQRFPPKTAPDSEALIQALEEALAQ